MIALNEDIDVIYDSIVDETVNWIAKYVKKPIEILNQILNDGFISNTITITIKNQKIKMQVIKRDILLDIANQVLYQLGQIGDNSPIPEGLSHFIYTITQEKACVANNFFF